MPEFLEVIRHEGSKWILYTHDGKKKLGEFATKEGALKRERQIQFYKHYGEARGGEMPYPNEHACRIKDPGDFEQGSFRRIKSGEKGGPGPRDGKQLSIIIGKLKGKSTTTTQTFRYPIDTWTEAQAKAHCKEQGGKFEPAAPAQEAGASGGDVFMEAAMVKAAEKLRDALDVLLREVAGESTGDGREANGDTSHGTEDFREEGALLEVGDE